MTGPEFISFLKEFFPLLSPSQEEKFLMMDSLYRDWNSKINVISRKDIDNLYSHHILHSLAIARYLQLRPEMEEKFRNSSVLDLGCGGGFPGIPLAVMFPDAHFTLCDSVGKKTIVASGVSESLRCSISTHGSKVATSSMSSISREVMSMRRLPR